MPPPWLWTDWRKPCQSESYVFFWLQENVRGSRMQGVPCRSAMWSVRATKSGAKWRILRLEMRPALRSLRLCFLAVGLKDFFAQRRRTFRFARFSDVLPCVTTCVHIVGNGPHWTAPEQIKTGQLHTISLIISYYLPWMTDSDLQDLDRCSSHDPLCTPDGRVGWCFITLSWVLGVATGSKATWAGMLCHKRHVHVSPNETNELTCLSRAISGHARIGELLRVVEEVTEGSFLFCSMRMGSPVFHINSICAPNAILQLTHWCT